MKIINTANYKKLLSLFLFGICLFNGIVAHAFQSDTLSNKETSIKEEIYISSDVREELHRYIGYEEVFITDVNITSGQEVVLNIKMQESINKMDEIVIMPDDILS